MVVVLLLLVLMVCVVIVVDGDGRDCSNVVAVSYRISYFVVLL